MFSGRYSEIFGLGERLGCLTRVDADVAFAFVRFAVQGLQSSRRDARASTGRGVRRRPAGSARARGRAVSRRHAVPLSRVSRARLRAATSNFGRTGARNVARAAALGRGSVRVRTWLEWRCGRA